MEKPTWLIVIGFIMEVAAIVLVALMLPSVNVIPSSILLNLFAFAISVAGLLMGVIGSVSIVKLSRDQRKKDQ